jgi:hypothetical protein
VHMVTVLKVHTSECVHMDGMKLSSAVMATYRADRVAAVMAVSIFRFLLLLKTMKLNNCCSIHLQRMK